VIRILKSCSSRFRCAIALGFVAFVGLGCSVWSASASAFTTTYDSLNRVTSVVYSPTQRIDYVYDAAGNLIEERVNGAAGLTVTAQASPAAGGSVTISPAQSSFVAGDVITITATPASGYNFTGWSGVAGCTAATSCTFTVGSSSITALANFSAVVVSGLRTLRAFAVPAVGGTITPTPNPAGYAPGTVLSFNASAIAPYEIDQWYGAGCPYLGGPTANER